MQGLGDRIQVRRDALEQALAVGRGADATRVAHQQRISPQAKLSIIPTKKYLMLSFLNPVIIITILDPIMRK